MFRTFIRRITETYVYGNFHIALAAVSLVLLSRDLLGLHMRPQLILFTFCGTLFFYTMQRLFGLFAAQEIEAVFRRHHWNAEHKLLLLVITIISGIAAAWTYFDLLPISKLLALIPGALSLLYALPVWPGPNRWKRLREIPGIKIFIVALVWGVVGVLIPAAASGTAGREWNSPPVLLWTVAATSMIFALTVPFDIRDLHYDGERLSSLPVLLGVKGAKIFALLALLVFPAMLLLLPRYGVDILHYGIAALLLWTLTCALLILRSSPQRSEFYFSFVIDGMIVLLWPAFLIGRCITL